jgi:hypothetical protein
MVMTDSSGARRSDGVGPTSESLLAQLERALNVHDPDGAARCFTDAGLVEWRIGAAPAAWSQVRGRPAIARSLARLMRRAPDATLEFTAVSYGSDRRIWAEWVLTRVERAGATVAAVGAAVFGLDADGFHEVRIYTNPRRHRRWIRFILPID